MKIAEPANRRAEENEQENVEKYQDWNGVLIINFFFETSLSWYNLKIQM